MCLTAPMYLAFLASAFDVLTLFPFSFAIAFASCDSRKYPYPSPPGGQWKFLGGGGGGAKGQKFTRGMGGAHKKNFPQGCKRRDRSYETYLYIWIFLIGSTTKIRSRCPFEEKKVQDVCLKRLVLCQEFPITSALMICPRALTI